MALFYSNKRCICINFLNYKRLLAVATIDRQALHLKIILEAIEVFQKQ